MDPNRGVRDRFAVVDVETTGLLNSDRVIEVAVVSVSMTGEIIDEWDTLVNPQRDTGPTHVHRITPSMVSAAPTFDEVATALADRLDGAVLVAHNLTFDSRMLSNEYRRLDVNYKAGVGVCTLRLTGEKLAHACARRNIPLDDHHRALIDARAAARLLSGELSRVGTASLLPAEISTDGIPFNPRTLRRGVADEATPTMPYLAHVTSRIHHYGEHGDALVYMDLLDWALSDLVLSLEEREQLRALATEIGLDEAEIENVHRRYLDTLIAAALRDGVVDDNELRVLYGAARELNIDASIVDDLTASYTVTEHEFTLVPGARVCFTGSATYPDGEKLPRHVLENAASDLGLVTVKGVTKKGCDLLVAVDAASQSGKTKQARGWAIPVVSVRDFLTANPQIASPSPEAIRLVCTSAWLVVNRGPEEVHIRWIQVYIEPTLGVCRSVKPRRIRQPIWRSTNAHRPRTSRRPLIETASPSTRSDRGSGHRYHSRIPQQSTGDQRRYRPVVDHGRDLRLGRLFLILRMRLLSAGVDA